jgi:cytochrome P450/NADPH-cytochrome P450 reductase
VFDKSDDWQENKLWPALGKHFNVEKSEDAGSIKALQLTVDVQSRSSLLRQDTQLGEVVETTLLTKPGAPRKRHIGIRLPSGSTYRAGDYLAVLPTNPPDLVKRVLGRFGLPWDAVIMIDESNATSLPKGTPISAHDVLASMVELEQPVSSRVAAAVAKSLPDAEDAKKLEERIKKGGLSCSLLDILEEHPKAQLSLAQFLAAMPPMRMRQYSISSTPLQDPTVATLTYSVIDAPNKTGGKGNFVGICTTYMERLKVGDRLHVSLKNSRAGFHLPADDSAAIIMACAGTGLAPFHAFVAERAIKKANGVDVGPAMLFYGCNQPDEDDMYREEFDAWEKQGVVSVHRAFSHKPEESQGTKYVQERIWHDREEVTELFRKHAQIYLCGAGMVGAGVEEVMARIRSEMSGSDTESAQKWVQDLKGDRYWSDVFS